MKTNINIFIFLLLCCVNNVYAISVYPMDNLQDIVNNNSFIYLNEGEYNINNLVVPDDVSIYGSGYDSVLISAGNICGVSVIGDNVMLCNFRFEGNADSTFNDIQGIRLDDADNCYVNRLWINDTIHHGLTVDDASDNVIIENCIVSNTGMYGLADGAGIIIKGSNCMVKNNIVYQTGYHGIQAYTNSNSCVISGNTIFNCGNNLRTGGSKGAGIKVSLNCNNIIVSDNIVNNGYGEGIIVDTANNVTITQNIITNCTRNVYARYSDNIIISSNNVKNGRVDGVYTYLCNDVITTNNILQNCNMKTYGTKRSLISLNMYPNIYTNGESVIVVNNFKNGVYVI